MIIFIIVWTVWFLSEVLLNRFLRSGTGDKKNQDKGTIRVIWITIVIANTLGILSSVFFKWPIGNFFIIPYSGLLLIIIGMIFRFIAVWSLGRLFTVDVTIRHNHTIKKDGMYRLIRHPSYTGLIISFIGFGLSFNNWGSLIVIGILVPIAILIRIKTEEKLLVGQFGEEYLDYMKRTKRLIPWIY